MFKAGAWVMLKLLLGLASCMGTWAGVVAAEPGWVCGGEPAEVSSRLMQPPVSSINFTQHTHIKILSAPLQSTGIVYIHRDYGVVWQVQQPLQSNLVINEHGIDMGTGIVDSSRMMGHLLRQIIVGNFQAIPQNFAIQACTSSSTQSADSPSSSSDHSSSHRSSSDQWRIQLEPKNKQMAAHLQRLIFLGDTWINSLHMQQANGNHVAIQFAQPQPLSQLPVEIANRLNIADLNFTE